jgi:hypothetical protein
MSTRLRARAGAPTVLRALRFTAIRLAGRPETQALAAEVQALRAGLQAAVEATEALQDATSAATAEINYRDEVEDDAVRALARDLRSLVAGDLRDGRWTRIFRDAPTTLIRPTAGAEQATAATHILRTLRDDPDYDAVRHHLPALEGARAGVEAAEAARDELRQQLYASLAAREEALEDAIRRYNRLRARVEVLFESAALVRSFFPEPREGGAAEAEG